jgi:HSP20 family protein
MILVKNPSEVKDFMPKSFTDIIDNLFNESLNATAVKFLPRADVAESDTSYEINLALPGVKKEEIKIDFQDGKLIVSGDRKLEKEGTQKKYHAIETQYGSFIRAFQFPGKVNQEGIEAEYINGILEIRIPKEEKKISKTSIQVK